MNKYLVEFNNVVKSMVFEKVERVYVFTDDDAKELKAKLQSLLKAQGREDMADDIMKDFTLDKINTMVNENIDLIDMDRWVLIENLLKRSITFKDAMFIANKLWEQDIEVLEISLD